MIIFTDGQWAFINFIEVSLAFYFVVKIYFIGKRLLEDNVYLAKLLKPPKNEGRGVVAPQTARSPLHDLTKTIPILVNAIMRRFLRGEESKWSTM